MIKINKTTHIIELDMGLAVMVHDPVLHDLGLLHKLSRIASTLVTFLVANFGLCMFEQEQKKYSKKKVYD